MIFNSQIYCNTLTLDKRYAEINVWNGLEIGQNYRMVWEMFPPPPPQIPVSNFNSVIVYEDQT